MTHLDHDSPVPLYHQIAESIRARIERGEIEPGETLPPMRDAAERWGVNFHTVRHAYTALAREGLVSAGGGRGTRVVAAATAPAPPADHADREAFVARIVSEARARFGVDRHELARLVERTPDPRVRPEAIFIECNDWESARHAATIAERFDVEVTPWRLEDPPPTTGTLVSTYFHYNDIRRRWPDRLRETRFVSVVPDPHLADRLPRPEGRRRSVRVRVCEFDRATAETIVADLSVALAERPYRLEPVVSDPPASLLKRRGPVLFAPRVWATLTESERAHPRAFEARYVLEQQELDGLGRELGWSRKNPPRVRSR